MKYLFLSAIVLILTACQKHDLNFYRVHPKALQEAMNQCPSQTTSSPSCEDLGRIAIDINQLVYELQQNAQQFGRKIIALQTNLVKFQAHFNQLSDSDTKKAILGTKIKDIQENLAMRLAVVGWLESPER